MYALSFWLRVYNIEFFSLMLLPKILSTILSEIKDVRNLLQHVLIMIYIYDILCYNYLAHSLRRFIKKLMNSTLPIYILVHLNVRLQVWLISEKAKYLDTLLKLNSTLQIESKLNTCVGLDILEHPFLARFRAPDGLPDLFSCKNSDSE